MPFRRGANDLREPDVVLEQTGPNEWRLVKGFEYVDPDGDGKPFPVRADTRTDLASVKWPLWWLVASYGRHTKAVLLHDELVDPTEDYPRKVPRREADRLLFVALQESGFGPPEKRKRPSWARRWFVWAAVAVLGTMASSALWRCLLFLAHVLLFWTLVGLWVYDGWVGDLGSVGSLDRWPLDLWQSILVVAALGFLWAFDPLIDTNLGTRAFLAVAAATPIVLPVILLILLAALVVALADLLYNIYRSLREGDLSADSVIPIVTPYRRSGKF